VAVFVTNELAVQVPVRMAAGLDALRAEDLDAAGAAALAIALMGLGVIVTRTLSRAWFFTPGRLAEFNLREDLFAHVLSLQPEFFGRYATGDVLSRITSDVTYARAFAGFVALQGVNVVVALALTTRQMWLISPELTGLCALPVLVAFAGVQVGAARLMRLQRQAQVQLAALSDEVLGTLQGVATVQGFAVEDVFVERLDGRAADLRRTSLESARIRALTFPLLAVGAGACVAFLLGFGGRAVVEGTVSPGGIAAFVGLVVYLVPSVRMLGWLVPVLQRSEAALERIHAVADARAERPDRGTGRVLAGGRGPEIEFRGLAFRYPGQADEGALRGVDAVIRAGSTVGIYGPTGSGKTTLLRLLSRLRNPPPGTVFVDGIDVRELDLDAFRQAVVLVPQAPFLFSESVRENIGFGQSDAVVRAAVEAAALAPDVEALPERLETVVGERGIVLSGGQRQRVAIARGLCRQPSIVLLDDVLSAVDH
jgi:ATP-binding cassette subfamily B protein